MISFFSSIQLAPAHAAAREDQTSGDVVFLVTIVVTDLVCATCCACSADLGRVATGSASVPHSSNGSNVHASAEGSEGAGSHVTCGRGPHCVTVSESHNVSSAGVSSGNASCVPEALSSVVSEDSRSSSVAGAWAVRACPDSAGGHVCLPVAVAVDDRVHTACACGDSSSVVTAISSPVGADGISGRAPDVGTSSAYLTSSSGSSPQVPWVNASLCVTIGVSNGVTASAANTGNPSGVPPATSSPVAHHTGSSSVGGG